MKVNINDNSVQSGSQKDRILDYLMEGYSLRWEATPLCSERVTDFTDGSCDSPSPSNESAVILRVLDIPSSRCLFRLRLSERPTGGTESSSLPMLQTPTAVMTCEPPEGMRARAKAKAKGYKNGTQYGSLESQINYDPRFKGLMPTPLAVDIQHKKSVNELKETGSKDMYSRINGDSRPNGLMDYLRFKGMLPTPTAIEGTKFTNTYNPNSQMGQSLSAMAGSMMLPTPQVKCATGGAHRLDDKGKRIQTTKNTPFSPQLSDLAVNGLLPTPTARDNKNPSDPEGERIARKKEQGWTIELNDMAAMGTLPTPSARDWKGKTNPGIVKVGSGCKYGETLPDTIGRICDPKEGGQTSRLSPLFTQEMMGFPFGWTELPFLLQSGEPRPSKPTETQ